MNLLGENYLFGNQCYDSLVTFFIQIHPVFFFCSLQVIATVIVFELRLIIKGRLRETTVIVPRTAIYYIYISFKKELRSQHLPKMGVAKSFC